MRAAIDARPALDPRKTGVGYYTHHMVRELPRADPDCQYTAWYLHARGLVRRRRFFDARAPNLSEVATPFPARLFEPVASRLSVPRLEWFLDFDVVLGTNFLPPATRSRGVVMVVHDLAFRLFPETAPQIDAGWRRRFSGWLARAARIIVPSGSAKHDLVELEGVESWRVDVVHHGVDHSAFGSPPESLVAAAGGRFGLDGPYVLFVGGIEPRKNLPLLVRAFAQVRTQAALVIAGGPVRWVPDAAARLRATVDALPEDVRRRVVLTGYVSEREKVGLLGGASALVYPSLYEGFGFPVLEAMAAGVPVLTSNLSSIPEVAGDAAVLVDPVDEREVAEAMEALLADEDLRARLRAAGPARAARFTWEDAARRTADVLHSAADATE